MKRHLICAIALPALVAIPSLAEENPSNETAGLPAKENAPAFGTTGTNLLYIVPRDQLGSNAWENLPFDNSGEYQPQTLEIPTNQVIYYVRDYTEIFGEDWVAVPVDESRSLYRLIGTRVPEENKVLPAFHVDSSRYHLEESNQPPVWPKEAVPKTVLLKWAEWWQTETNATPVVLILIRF